MLTTLSTRPEGTRWVEQYLQVRRVTDELAAPLSPEDQMVQSMPDVSPTKWHRAHTTWFFEEFVLGPHLAGYSPFDPGYAYLFNSYYETVGPRWPRHQRGLVSRPSVGQVAAYRGRVDEAMAGWLAGSGPHPPRALELVELGCHHEQQHQELLLMDIKHVLSIHPDRPAYRRPAAPSAADGRTGLDGAERPGPASEPEPPWWAHQGGLVEVGHTGEGFAFDNESPRHAVHLRPFELSRSPVTNADWLGFIDDGGYQRPDLWLSEGWATVQAQGWEAPLYWERRDGTWWTATLTGARPVEGSEPVCHVSYFEADAYARWAGARLPTEAEWEALAAGQPRVEPGHFLDSGLLHPRPVPARPSLIGDVWQWTSSSYSPYPGYQPAPGAVGEYNGKFMVNQYVLRGGSCVTPAGHVRATYRNFFPASARWAFSGLRLARDL